MITGRVRIHLADDYSAQRRATTDIHNTPNGTEIVVVAEVRPWSVNSELLQALREADRRGCTVVIEGDPGVIREHLEQLREVAP